MPLGRADAVRVESDVRTIRAGSGDTVRDAESLQTFDRLRGTLGERVERVGGATQVVDRDAAGFQREPAKPADGCALIARSGSPSRSTRQIRSASLSAI